MYAKLQNTALIPAPKIIIIDDVKMWNAPADIMLELGWKPVTFTDPPEPEEGFYYESGWKETAKKITQTWTKKETPDEVSAEEALAAILEVLE